MYAVSDAFLTIPDSSGGDASADETTDGSSTDDESAETSGTEVEVSLPVTWTEGGEAQVYVTYEYNNSYITAFAPVETWHSGKHILTLFYPIEDIAASVASHFNVYLLLKAYQSGRNGWISLEHAVRV